MDPKKIVAVFILLFISFLQVTAQPKYVSKVWVADKGNGTYQNPVLWADYSDPDAIRVGNDYYLVASSFNAVPGLPILHSKDLINWHILNYALKKQEPAAVYNTPQHGKGVWAPAIRYHHNEFYIFYPDPDYGIYMIHTKDPAAAWSKPVLMLPGKGIIDPCPLWDDNGTAYLVTGWAASRAGVNSLLTVYKMKPDGTAVLDEGKHVYDGHVTDPTVEGPKLYKRNGYYYLFAPAGGVVTGWQIVLRSKSIYGPYERRKVMEQGATDINGPHQGAWVTTVTGEDWFLHFRDKGAYGRILYLEPMAWKNDWPVMGTDPKGTGMGTPVQTYRKPNAGKIYPIETPIETDEFNTDTLGLQWQWQANSMIQWYALMKGAGYLRLFAYPSDTGKNLWTVPNLLLQKIPAPACTVTAKISLTVDKDACNGKKAGLVLMGSDYAYISINRNEAGYSIRQVICKNADQHQEEEIAAAAALSAGTAYLRMTIAAPDAQCQFSFSEDGITYKTLGKSFEAKPGRWIGAKIGLFCTATPASKTSGYADIDWFRITK